MQFKLSKITFLVIFFLNQTICQISFTQELSPLQSIPSLNLSQYLGTWYEIARFENTFQKDCDEATAVYSLNEDGKINVTNTCRQFKNGSLTQVTGVAKVEDPVSHSKLKVNFVPSWLRWTGIGNGDYWVIDIDQKYTYAVISEPKRKYLWILSRTPTMDPVVYQKILTFLGNQSFDTA